MEEDKGFVIKVKRVLAAGSQPPKSVNKFVWTHIDNAYHLETSHYDPFSYGELAGVIFGSESEDPPDSQQYTLEFNVTDRFILFPRDVAELYETAKAMYQDAVDRRLIQADDTQLPAAADS